MMYTKNHKGTSSLDGVTIKAVFRAVKNRGHKLRADTNKRPDEKHDATFSFVTLAKASKRRTKMTVILLYVQGSVSLSSFPTVTMRE